MDASPAATIGENESIGVVCPVYAWAVPRLVERYIMRLTTNLTPKYCYLACTCGDNVGRTPERFAKTLKQKGWILNAAFSFIMPETYINLPRFKLDNKEGESHKIEEVKRRIPKVAEKIINRTEETDVVRGKMAWMNTYLINPLFYKKIITDKKFRVTDSCIGCGTCEQVCQLQNITFADGQPKWNGKCTNCMACYHNCPTNAIQFGKATEGKGQYIFKD